MTNKHRLVVLDVDGTLLKGQSQQYLLKYLRQKRIISSFFYYTVMIWFVLYKARIVSNPERVMTYAYSFTEGWSKPKMDAILECFVIEVLESYFFTEAKALISKHKKCNDFIILVSNMPEPLLAQVAKYLNVMNYIGTTLELVRGRYTGRMCGGIVYGPNKLVKLLSYSEEILQLNFEDSYAYADHHSDIPILGYVSNAIVVNPNNKLRRYAEHKNWKILVF